MPFDLAVSTTSLKFANDCSIVVLMFFLVKVSEAAPKTAISYAPTLIAPSNPFIFGVNTEYDTPSRLSIPR